MQVRGVNDNAVDGERRVEKKDVSAGNGGDKLHPKWYHVE